MYDPLHETRADFIDEGRLNELLKTDTTTGQQFHDIMDRARRAQGLGLEDVAHLLAIDNRDQLQEIFDAASEIKERVYGKRIVIFAPLYISNHCINGCRYCGYRMTSGIRRRRLSMEEVAEEVRVLEGMGHKRLALEAGEDPENCPLDYVLEALETIYSVRQDQGAIRRVNVNIAATTVKEYQRLKAAGIGTYILFQETYHRDTYRRLHPQGPKSDFDWHALAMDRAMEAGTDDVGIGALFGLYDYRFEVLALIQHAHHLEEAWGVGPHTISVPRLRPAQGVTLDEFPHLVSDEDFRKTVAILRLAVPYTGMILSTRERPDFRDQVIAYGISQISAGSCTGVGAYREQVGQTEETEQTQGTEQTQQTEQTEQTEQTKQTKQAAGGILQFSVDDQRSTAEIIASLMDSGYIPSYCTACYRQGRTGERFMGLAKSGQIQNVCQPNALLTLAEYLVDYAPPALARTGWDLIDAELQEIPNERVRRETRRRIEEVRQGVRDLYF